jgi:hypothetical protein
MKWIPIKHPILIGVALDRHQVVTPSLPLGPPIPSHPHVMPHHIPPGELIWGKWTDASSVAQGFGVCLWQHDWGMGQIHVTVPVSAWLAMIPLGSTLKLQLPSSSQKLRATGGAVAMGDECPPAPALPSGFIVCQSCWDIGGFGFVAPTGMHFSPVANVFLDVRLGDVLAGVFAMGSDALSNLAGSYFGNRLGGKAGWAVGQLMGTFGRTKFAIAYFSSGTLGLWDAVRARPGQRFTPKGAVKNWSNTGPAILATIGSMVCDWAAESIQDAHVGPQLGEAPPPGSELRPAAGS